MNTVDEMEMLRTQMIAALAGLAVRLAKLT